MKFRRNSIHEFCVTNALHLDVGLIVYIKCPILVLFAFCHKTHQIQKISIAVHSQPFEIFVLFSAFRSESFKIIPLIAVEMKFDLLAHLVA